MFSSFGSHFVPHINLGDERLNKRLGFILDSFTDNFGKTIPGVFNDRSQTKACYNFLKHKQILDSKLVKAEQSRLFNFIDEQKPKVILAIQDTTELDFTNKRVADKVGYLNDKHHKGYFLHSHILTDSKGCPLGLFDHHTYTRSLDSLGKSKERKYDPFDTKESFRWLDQFNKLQDAFSEKKEQTVICICDSEADIHELLQAPKHKHIHLLVRSKHNRKLLDKDKALKEIIYEKPFKGKRVFDIIDEQTGKKRSVTAQVRFGKVTISTSYRGPKQDPIFPTKLNVITLLEENPPANVKPVEWTLLTTLDVENVEQANKIIDFYVLRWRIETFFYVLKQGCKIEELQLTKTNGILNAITIYSIVALQVLRIRYLAETVADEPLQKHGLSLKDYKILCLYFNGKNNLNLNPNKADPTVRDLVSLIAKLGGSMLWKGKFGVKAIWQGYRNLELLRQAYDIFT